MNKLCMPRVNSLVERVSTCQEIRRRLGVPVHVIHVPREMNQLADWLSRCGTAYGRDVSLAELAMNFEETCAPPKQVPTIAQYTTSLIANTHQTPACGLCNSHHDEALIECQACPATFHKSCISR
jgi:hypothetical protein